MKLVSSVVAAMTLSFVSAAVDNDINNGMFMSAAGQQLMREKMEHWASQREKGLLPRTDVSSSVNAPQVCSGGSVSINGESFPCNGIDFESFISLGDTRIPNNGGTTQGSDIWGWLSPEGREITLWCQDVGIWFIDGTDPANPLRLGYMPSGRSRDAWCDVKVYENTAYVVKDNSFNSQTTYGIEVFDLTRLAGLGDNPSRSFSPDTVYTGHGKSHNVVSDTESGFLYSVGTNTCSGGLHMVDIRNPLNPTFAGCVSSDGYTHDAQCVVYRGPDSRYTGRQICLAFNEDTLTIWDVTNKNNVQQLARRGYSGSRYSHQGWFSEDFEYVLLDDELDERNNGNIQRTTTYVFNVINLENPVLETVFTHPEVSVDHNLYNWGAIHKNGWGGNPPLANPPSGRYAYLSNYVAGIKVLDLANLPNVVEAGKFDVAPDLTGNVFEGTWSNYMHPSGVLAVSSIDRGLFFLRPQMAFDGPPPTDAPTPPPVPTAPTPTPAPTPFPTNFPVTPAPTAPPTCFFFFC